ncbi:3-oxoacyl-[acyl-carrier-protein] synthase III C-terminal domain-containing protein [Streptomyces sp. T028]|uniref:3-oxoacyl-[acyl-carrier-protein] synthase III C-terminal domain-containing protein n=1 Tax=Streptomyces sp. T028 TaxID=3394379 RepID=UPI003A87E61F
MTGPSRGTYLSSLAHVCGDRRKVAELTGAPEELLAPLVREIVHFRESGQDIWELAAASAGRTLAESGARPDLVVYVSENDPDVTGSLARITDRLRLTSANHLALAGRDCGNLAPALEVAAALLAGGRHRRVLLLLADRALTGRRVMASGLSVFSDGAASCLLTAEPTAAARQLRLDAVASSTAVRTADSSAETAILSTVALAARSITAVLDDVGATRHDFAHAVLPNYRPTAQQFLMAALKLQQERLLPGPVTEIGHCFSADVLIALQQHLEAGTLPPGNRVLAGVSGPHTWSTLALTRIP